MGLLVCLWHNAIIHHLRYSDREELERMELTVLGGSAAGPNPGQGCSGCLIESGATQVVVDLGPGTFTELRRHVDYRSIDGVVLSHGHLDHFLDVLTLRYALAYNPVPAAPAAVVVATGWSCSSRSACRSDHE